MGRRIPSWSGGGERGGGAGKMAGKWWPTRKRGRGGLGTRASHYVSKIHLLGVYITRQALIYQSKSKNKLILHMHAKIAKRKFSIL